MNIIRTIVSGEKKRYIDENFNLDLSYVTPRIIAMAFPGTGITSIYRNKLNDVADFLNQKHPNNYLILNLSGIFIFFGQPLNIIS
jgi:phosphatidylinositol-3,4,5-trisphosphate 3-phosphatase/dual-specificity protein phosphatase PTEN